MSEILLGINVLLGVVGVSGVFVYIYLHQEQNKLSPKTKYDEAPDEAYKENYPQIARASATIGESLETLLSKLFRTFQSSSNFSILIITFIVAMLISIVPFSVIYLDLSANESGFGGLVLMLSLSPFLIPFFPEGLLDFMVNTTKTGGYSNFDQSIIFGWLIYFVVFLLGTFTKKRSVFVIIYLLFITLLIMNIIGCVQGASPMCAHNSCGSM